VINRKIFNLLLKKDQQAERNLIEALTPRLIFYFRKNINGDFPLEDMIQNTLLALFQAIAEGKIPDHNAVIPFLYGIARRNVYNFFYESKKNAYLQQKAPDFTELISRSVNCEQLIQQAQLEQLKTILIRLAPIDRQIIEYFFLQEWSLDQLSKHFKKSKHYISVRKERALKRLRREIFQNKPYK